MGTMDRPGGIGDQADVPVEIASEQGGWKFTPSGDWLNIDKQSDRQLLAGHDRPATPFDRPSASGIEVSDSPLPRWKIGDPIEVPPLLVRTDVGPGKVPPDYRDPDAKDPLKVEPGQDVIVGKAGSEDNPKRYVVVDEGVELRDVPLDEPLDDNPSGDEYLDMDPSGRSRARDLLKGTVERFDDVADAIQKAGNQLEDSLKSPAPTGTETRLPPGTPVYDTPPNAATAGSATLGLVELGILTVAAVRTGIRHHRESAKERADDASNG